MIKKLILPLIAIAGLSFSLYTVRASRKAPEQFVPQTQPPTQNVFKRTIAGAGIIEARLENIPVGSPVPGVVWEIYVKVKDRVKKGDPLFRIDDRDLRAELEVREANLASAIASARRLEVAPQNGDVAYNEAAVEEARAKMNDAEAAAGRTDRLFERRMAPAGDHDKDRYTFLGSKATLAKAMADLNRLKVTWEADKQVSKATVAMADAQVRSLKIQLERLVVRALADGEILQMNVRPGMFAGSMWNTALVVIGDSNRLHVRVDIDENDVPYFDPKARAIATLKGRPGEKFELVPFKVEPYVIPKKSLTGDNSERVDTRVLQVVYSLPTTTRIPLYVGQQMDAYIEAGETAEGIDLRTDLSRPSPFLDKAEPTPSTTPETKDKVKDKPASSEPAPAR